ncbi:MAG TPA: PrsW family glutamic-type intramembrane protease [Thermoplasmata archaeon]|nr:PrsW family glutamic-type intramembrane protease [Thermoplasmata archaeon]
MTDFGAGWDLLVLVIVAFVPALVYLSWIRGTERYGREKWGPLLRAFLYGALFATITAGILELIIVSAGTAISQNYPAPEFVFLNGNSDLGALFLVLVIAPFVEEGLKGTGVVAFRSSFRQLADGPVFGASVGLGFGFFETFLYGLGAFFVGGLAAGLALILIRSVSSVLLHGSSTGMFGYGYARSKFGQPGPGTGSYYMVAVGMHASFNFLASLAAILTIVGIGGFAVDAASFIALFAAIFFAIWAIEHVRSIIQASDYPGLLGPTTRGPSSRPGSPGRR